MIGLISSFFLSILIITAAPRIRSLTLERGDSTAVQSSYDGDPMRLGGFAIMGGLIVILFYNVDLLATGVAGLIMLSALPVLLAGALEDMGRHVSAKGRLIAAGVSSAVAIILLEFWIGSIDLAPVDYILQFIPLSIALTILVTASFCHAFNLVDGMNGLASSVGIVAAAGFGLIAYSSGNHQVGQFAFALCTVILGFAALNWPVARLFLGDAGAYGIGHMLVWTAITLSVSQPEIAVPALVLVIFWPVADTLHTIMRRVMEQKSIFEPDKMHLHQKVRRGLEIVFFGSGRRKITNPLTTVVLLPFIVAPAITGVLLAEETTLAWIAIVVYLILFASSHLVATHIARKLKKRRFQCLIQQFDGAIRPDQRPLESVTRPGGEQN